MNDNDYIIDFKKVKEAFDDFTEKKKEKDNIVYNKSLIIYEQLTYRDYLLLFNNIIELPKELRQIINTYAPQYINEFIFYHNFIDLPKELKQIIKQYAIQYNLLEHKKKMEYVFPELLEKYEQKKRKGILHVHAINYNLMRIMDGMAGLQYST